MILQTNKLSEIQIQEITALENRAFEKDGLENHSYLSNNLNMYPDMPCFFLGYEEDTLVGFLTAFVPEKDNAEILAVTDPIHQRTGWFKRLYHEALTVLRQYGVQHILFAVEHKSISGNAVLSRFESRVLERSEYRMELEKDSAELGQISLKGTSKRITPETRHIFQEISDSANEEAEDEAYLDLIATSDQRCGYIYFFEGSYVGTYVIGTDESGTFIYGVAIRKEDQGKGISKYMMKHAINDAFNRTDHIFLEVDSHNPPALRLYRRCGFQIVFQVDYFKITICTSLIVNKRNRMTLKERAAKLKMEIPAVFLCLKDRETPLSAKIFAALTVGYALSPIDLIPDFIPLLGYLDDLLILPGLVALTIHFIPQSVWKKNLAVSEDLWKDGKPNKWYYAIPIILIWLLVVWLIIKAVRK